MSIAEELEDIFPAGSVIGVRWKPGEPERLGIRLAPMTETAVKLTHRLAFRQWLSDVDEKEASWERLCWGD